MTRYAMQIVMGSWLGSLVAYFLLLLPAGMYEQPRAQGVQAEVVASRPSGVHAPAPPLREACPEVAVLQDLLAQKSEALRRAQAEDDVAAPAAAHKDAPAE